MELNLTICSLIFQTRHTRTDKQKFQFQRSNTIDRSEILLEELSKCLWAPKHPSIKKGRTKKKEIHIWFSQKWCATLWAEYRKQPFDIQRHQRRRFRSDINVAGRWNVYFAAVGQKSKTDFICAFRSRSWHQSIEWNIYISNGRRHSIRKMMARFYEKSKTNFTYKIFGGTEKNVTS